MQASAYEGYFNNGQFYVSGKTVSIPEKRRIVITILDDDQTVDFDEPATTTQKSMLQFDFVTDVPPLPDSFFDPLPEEELALWGL